MNTKLKYGIFILIPGVLFFIGFNNAEKIKSFPLNADNKIDYRGFFPKPDVPIATSSLSTVEVSKTKNVVAIVEQRPSTVYLFKKDGSYIGEAGKKGRGPGEYSFVNRVSLFGDGIILNDEGNAKIIAFDQQENELYSFGPDFLSAYIIGSTKGVLLFPYYNQVAGRDASLYSLLDRSGNKIGDFGNIPPKIEALPSYPQLNLSFFNDKIYVLPLPSETVYRYNIEEDNYKSIQLKGRDYSTEFKKIEDSFPDVSESIRTKFVDMKVNEDGIFVSIFHSGLIIDQYDLEGNYVQRFNFKGEYSDDKELKFTPEDRYIRSFDMIKLKNNYYRFYGSVSSNYARILMFDIRL